MIATIIEAGKLGEVILWSLCATIGVAALFSLAILGVTQASERRNENRNAALAYGALAVIGLIGCLAAAAYGLALLASK